MRSTMAYRADGDSGGASIDRTLMNQKDTFHALAPGGSGWQRPTDGTGDAAEVRGEEAELTKRSVATMLRWQRSRIRQAPAIGITRR